MNSPTSLASASGLDFQNFASVLLLERGIGDTVPADIQAEMKNDIIDRLSAYLNAAVIRAVPPEDLEAFSVLLEGSPSPEDTKTFLLSKIPALDAVLAQAVVDFRLSYLS